GSPRRWNRRRRLVICDRSASPGPARSISDDPTEVGEPRGAPTQLDDPAQGAAQRATAASRSEEGADRPGELRLAQVPHDPGPLDETDLAVLLRHDDDGRIRLLRDPESRPVAGPEPPRRDRHRGPR